jgi:hypothetical protein
MWFIGCLSIVAALNTPATQTPTACKDSLKEGGAVAVVANMCIEQGEELTCNYINTSAEPDRLIQACLPLTAVTISRDSINFTARSDFVSLQLGCSASS